ncbi:MULTISPECIES: DegT/DnrJ/EryC1/StrS aminotransferase family protein [unclassified Oleiphilus]|uniref:DegT/DnrJ/EryC1/StrS family aminotransferase n=1 Tax=unclassified Oleiphilus TaxID=2631174 RepID=UPI0007C20AEF|nr:MULTISPECIES: DegT/DnrJ/EryC1/StrS family aminotransferase [unclassified Oleiphilus]KZZ37192.1 hypothetical protein A3757_12210 [Oleiphilus sp. HI0117]KZZ53089.1 hypothetical protein A3761_18245 [Oleiphilus sp. HI0123]
MISYFIPDMPVTDQLIPYLREIDDKRWYSNFGPLYERFQHNLADKCLNGIDPKRLAIVSSGTSAIELSLKSLSLPLGAKVLTSSFTFPATIEAIINAGLTPVVCDIDKEGWALTPDIASLQLKEHNIAAVVPVAAFGTPLCSESWSIFCQKTGIPVIFDAAAALGNQSIRDNIIYAFSLHATKPIGAGEGGLVVCPSKEHALQIKKASNFGFEPDRSILSAGGNAKISEYHCAIGLAQLDRLTEIISIRDSIFKHYKEAFRAAKLPLSLQAGTDKFTPSSLYVTFENQKAEQLSEFLYSHQIESRRLYYPLINQHAAFKHNTIEAKGGLEHSIRCSENGIALPFHAYLTHEQIDNVTRSISKFVDNQA